MPLCRSWSVYFTKPPCKAGCVTVCSFRSAHLAGLLVVQILLDLLFGAPLPPLERLALALRAGRAMTGSSGDLFTRYISSGTEGLPDPFPSGCTLKDLREAELDGRFELLLNRIEPGIRDAMADWFDGMKALEEASGMEPLICGIAEVGSHLVSLPMAGMLPALDPARIAIAQNLGHAIGSVAEQTCALTSLIEMFKFLGGSFTDHTPFAITVPGEAPPVGRIERWSWLCRAAESARSESENIWRRLVDPVQ